MEKRRLMDVNKFANKLFHKCIFDNAIAQIDGKLQRRYIAERTVEYIVKEVELIVDDNERIKQEKLRWVMNQSMQTRLKLEMELEEQRIKGNTNEHSSKSNKIGASLRRRPKFSNMKNSVDLKKPLRCETSCDASCRSPC
jgi:hypothetical protein